MRALAIALGLFTITAASGQTLQAVDPVVSHFEDGPPLSENQPAVPGELVSFRFAALHFKTTPDGALKLTGHAQLLDSRGTPVTPLDEMALSTSLREEDKEYKPRLHFQFQLPSIAPPGSWRIKFDVTDAGTKQSAQGMTEFAVTGRNVEPAQALAVRNLQFLRTQDDETPLKAAAYRPGDMVWARFDMTGYKYGDQNAVDVTYDVAVTSPAGKAIFRQENAASEKSQAYYPQPWIPATFGLTLQTNISTGSYVLTITAHDAIGNGSVMVDAPFKVE